MKKLKHRELSNLFKVTELLSSKAGRPPPRAASSTVCVPHLFSQLALPAANEVHAAVIHVACERRRNRVMKYIPTTTANWSVAELGQAPALGPQPDQTTHLTHHRQCHYLAAARCAERVRKKALLALWRVTEPGGPQGQERKRRDAPQKEHETGELLSGGLRNTHITKPCTRVTVPW